MTVVSVLNISNICESFTHNLLTRAQGKTTFLSLMRIPKKCIANAYEFESDFGGGKNGCACVSMGDQQYNLYSYIIFVPPRKPGLSPTYPLNLTHGDTSVENQQQKNFHKYQRVKNTNSALNKIVFTAIGDQCIKGLKDMVIGYADKYFVELLDWLYIRFFQMPPQAT